MKLKTGCYYWMRQVHEKIWRVVYIGEDPDEDQWLHQISVAPILVSDMELGYFDFIELLQPDETDIQKQWSGDTLVRLTGGETFRCECGCNVFRKLLNSNDGGLHFKCNGCQATYTGDK